MWRVHEEEQVFIAIATANRMVWVIKASLSPLFNFLKLVSYLFDMAMRLPLSRREASGVNAEREILCKGFCRYLIVFKPSIPTSRYSPF